MLTLDAPFERQNQSRDGNQNWYLGLILNILEGDLH